MRVSEQKMMNKDVKDFLEYYRATDVSGELKFKKLRTCQAQVRIDEKFYTLISYTTVVAIIDRETSVLYDFSRLVYGYTATTSQHICKFARDYGAIDKLTYKAI